MVQTKFFYLFDWCNYEDEECCNKIVKWNREGKKIFPRTLGYIIPRSWRVSVTIRRPPPPTIPSYERYMSCQDICGGEANHLLRKLTSTPHMLGAEMCTCWGGIKVC